MIKKTKVGRVVSTKMDKTVVITVETPKRHPLYKKVIRTNKRYKAHDEKNECRLTDTVKIEACRPLSREKRWRVIEVMVRGEALEYTPKQVTEATQVMPEKLPEVAPEVEAVVEAPAIVEVETEAEAETEIEAETEAEAAPEAEVETEVEAEVEVETEAEAEAAAEPEAEAETEPETK